MKSKPAGVRPTQRPGTDSTAVWREKSRGIESLPADGALFSRNARPLPWLAVFLCRAFLLLFLAYHAWTIFRGSLDFAYWLAGFALGTGLALASLRLRFRFWVFAAAAVLLPVFVRFAGLIALHLFTGSDVFHRDVLLYLWDDNLKGALPVFGATALLSFLSSRYPALLYGEAFLYCVAFVRIFLPFRDSNVVFFDHPLTAVVRGLLFGASFTGFAAAARRLQGGPMLRRRRAKRVVPVLVLVLIAGLAGFFVLRWYSGQALTAGGGLIRPTLFRFDFSNFLDLEREITMDNSLVFLLRTDARGPLYVRRLVLGGYTRDRGFFFEEREDARNVPVPDQPLAFPGPFPVDGVETPQDYYLVRLDGAALLALNAPERVLPASGARTESFVRVYRVVSSVGTAGAETLSATPSPDLSGIDMNYYTRSPNDPDYRDLAENLTRGMTGYYERVRAIRNYLFDNYYYSATPGAPRRGEDPLKRFLFDTRKGYCSYFASAMALLCRSIGIPARIAVGFYVRPDAAVLDFYPVRGTQAHAWVEVWFGEYGWVAFDPTSTTLYPGEQLPFDPDALPFESGMEDIEGMIRRIIQSPLTFEDGAQTGAAIPTAVSSAAPAPLAILASALSLLIAAAAVLAWRYRYRVAERLERSLRRRTLLRFLDFRVAAGLRGWHRSRGETLLEYAARVGGRTGLVRFREPFELYERALLAPDFSPADFAVLVELIETLRRELPFRARGPERIRRLLRSLSGRRAGKTGENRR